MKKFILSAFADEYADSLPSQLEALKSFDIGYIELRFINGVSISELPEKQIYEIKKLTEDYGIGISAIGSPLGKIPLDGNLEEHLEKARRTFETANILGVKNIRFFSFYPPKGRAINECRQEVFEAVDKLVTLSEEHGVTLCHENEAEIYGESPESCLELLDTFSGRIKCVFDMGNFVIDGHSPFPHGLELLKDHIEYFHIKDSLSAGAVVPPGKGEACIAEILKSFGKSMPRDTFITLEPHLQTFSGLNALVGKKFDNPYKFPDRETAFAEAVKNIKDILANLGE